MAGCFDPIWKPNTLPLSEIPTWYPLREAANERAGFCPAVRGLFFQQLRHDHMCILDFTATSVACLLAESCFIPVIDEYQLLPPAEEYTSLSDTDRNMKLAADLKTVLNSQGDFRRTFFRYIIRREPDENTASEEDKTDEPESVPPSVTPSISVPEYQYGPHIVTVSIIGDVSRIMIHAQTTGFEKSYTFRAAMIYPGLEGTVMFSYTPMGAFRQAKIQPKILSQKVKSEISFPLVDTLNSFCPEVRGFQNVPPEVLLLIAEKLDVRSFVNFTMTSTYIRHAVDSNEGWKKMKARAILDFRSYGLSEDFIREFQIQITSRMETGNAKESYILAYAAAEEFVANRGRFRNLVNFTLRW